MGEAERVHFTVFDVYSAIPRQGPSGGSGLALFLWARARRKSCCRAEASDHPRKQREHNDIGKAGHFEPQGVGFCMSVNRCGTDVATWRSGKGMGQRPQRTVCRLATVNCGRLSWISPQSVKHLAGVCRWGWRCRPIARCLGDGRWIVFHRHRNRFTTVVALIVAGGSTNCSETGT